MAPMPQGQGQNPDNHMAAMWISLGIFVVGLILWAVFRKPFVIGFLYVKYAELSLIGIFTQKAITLQAWITSVDPDKVQMSQLVRVGNFVGEYFKYPVSIILLIFSYFLYNRSVGSRFKTMHSMKSLLKQEVKYWPQSMPVVSRDLIKEDIDKGPWAMSMTPMIFAKKYDLLKVQKKALEEGMLQKERSLEATLIKAKANQLFVKQLGPLWSGVDRLPMHMKALFAAFAARIANDPDASADLLKQINTSANGGKLNFSGVKELLDQYKNHKMVVKTMEHHAYVLTVMAEMLDNARLTGVLATADFLWLKIVDRRLWFMLNSVGRQTPCVEVAGPFAHWKFESTMERPFRTPMIDEATRALEVALTRQVYTEDDSEGQT